MHKIYGKPFVYMLYNDNREVVKGCYGYNEHEILETLSNYNMTKSPNSIIKFETGTGLLYIDYKESTWQ